jgi:hypothetical protein
LRDESFSREQAREQPMMKEAHIMSNWLRQYIRERGGALNISTRVVIVG